MAPVEKVINHADARDIMLGREMQRHRRVRERIAPDAVLLIRHEHVAVSQGEAAFHPCSEVRVRIGMRFPEQVVQISRPMTVGRAINPHKTPSPRTNLQKTDAHADRQEDAFVLKKPYSRDQLGNALLQSL